MHSEISETKICKCCGEEKTIDKFKKFTKNGKKSILDLCKDCSNQKRLVNKDEKFRKEYLSNDKYRIKRKYKKPHQSRILNLKKIGIELKGKDEYFVKLLNYKNAWISNYGRLLRYYNGNYFMAQKKYGGDGEIAYTLDKNIFDGEKWIWARVTVAAWELVVKEFIVNYDMTNNTCCWHKDGKKADNYYKHIYPVNSKQYQAIADNYDATGDDSKDAIFDIINDINYKPDGWYAMNEKRTVFKKGYHGCSESITDKESDNYPIYRKWVNMMQRCYSKKVHKLKPYYKGCKACEEWHSFANFRKWYVENAMIGKKLDLDKDILLQGSKIYSPETCCLVPHFTNTVFEERTSKNCVVKNAKTGMYDAFMSILGKNENIGSFDTEEKARKAYVEYKTDYIRKLAQKSKGKVPEKVYDAMMRWKVEICD